MAELPAVRFECIIREEEVLLRQRLRLKVRALREEAGMTLKVAAARGEMHWRHWQKLEAGELNVTISTLVRVAQALRVDVLTLFSLPVPAEDSANGAEEP